VYKYGFHCSWKSFIASRPFLSSIGTKEKKFNCTSARCQYTHTLHQSVARDARHALVRVSAARGAAETAKLEK
jgi:hypothetical protein